MSSSITLPMPKNQPPADNDFGEDDLDNDPELKAMEEKLKKKMQEIKESDNPHLFTFDDGDTVDFSKPPDTSFADDQDPDSEGYKTISWEQLKKKFCYERPAHGFKLCGDISQKLQEHWERSKQIKIRDKDGTEGAVFFYCDESKPYFDWDDVCVGNNITVKSPRFHRFMDKQEGMRVEDASQICPIEKQKFTDSSRLDYGVLNKNHGNKRFQEGKFDDAMEFYDTAIRHLRGTFKENPEDEQKGKELTAQCYLNIAACHIGNKNFQYVESACQSALRINASQSCNAKAYFRIGSASLERRELTHAKTNLERALQLAPGDEKIIECINKLNGMLSEQKTSDKKLFKTDTSSKFGARKWILSDLPEALNDNINFRDVTKVIGKHATGEAGVTLKKNVLYRTSTVSAVTPRDLAILKEQFGVKTIIDLRSDAERKMGGKHFKQEIKDGKRIATETHFLPVIVSCKSKTGQLEGDPKIKLPKKPLEGDDDVLSGRVTYEIDLGGRAVKMMTPSWVIFVLLCVGWIAFIIPKAWGYLARFYTSFNVAKAGPKGTYTAIIDKCKPEMKEVFRILCKESNYPVVMSCSLGKDRTGLTIALALSAIGVPDHLVAADYAETTKCLDGPVTKGHRWMGLPKEWDTASEVYMLDTLRHINEKYGSTRKYLTNECGISEEELASLKNCLCKVPVVGEATKEDNADEDRAKGKDDEGKGARVQELDE